MFCARCWSPVGPFERTCGECDADLTLPGSVRLTDPRRVLGDSAALPAATGASTPIPPALLVRQSPDEPASQAPAVAPDPGVAEVGPGWWHGVKSSLLAIGEKARMADHGRQEPPVLGPGVAVLPVEHQPGPAVSPDQLAESVVHGPAVTGPAAVAAARVVHGASRVARPDVSPVSGAALPAVAGQVGTVSARVVHGASRVARPDESTPRGVAVPAMEGAVAAPAQADPDGKPTSAVLPVRSTGAPEAGVGSGVKAGKVRRPRPDRDPNELNLWDDYGMADTAGWPHIDHAAPRGRQVLQLIGATALPTAKTITFLAVLGGGLLLLGLLVAWLLAVDRWIVLPAGDSSPSAASSSPAPTRSTPEPAQTTHAPPRPPVKQTPVMAPGAKECQPGVWAGPQTSCALANAVAQELRVDMIGSVVVEAFSTSSNRTYRLECVADGGITCTGLDGVEGVLVWLVGERQ